MLLFTLILTLIAEYIEIDISVPGFPDMANYFNVSTGIIQSTVTYNFLGICISVLIFGPLSECYGRRKVIIAGSTMLLIGAIGCIIAPSINWLLISRFIQGIGAGTSAIIFAVVADKYQGNKAVSILSIMNAITTVATAIAPVIGSFINEAIGWRGNYFSIALISFVSWVLLLAILPETKKDLAVFSIKKITEDYRKLLTSSKFIALTVIQGFLSGAYMSFIVCAPFLYIKTFGLHNTIYALNQGAVIGCFSIVSLFSSKIIKRLKAKSYVILGTFIIFIGSLLLAAFSIIIPYVFYAVTLSMIVFATGAGICFATIFNASINVFPEVKGTASSAISLIRSMIMAIFIGLTSHVFNGKTISVSFIILFAVALQLMFTIYLIRLPKVFDIDSIE
ncbi:multidrug effflux MFS transporter [Wolbachia endosymbiont of Pentidionis agamae]|uniref:multidrug effflux MFS transporter n=1 Tax=Wolbachia endosymbiont of Pentidionis agamae TaxID=3110435 RepID=UPI002FD39974